MSRCFNLCTITRRTGESVVACEYLSLWLTLSRESWGYTIAHVCGGMFPVRLPPNQKMFYRRMKWQNCTVSRGRTGKGNASE